MDDWEAELDRSTRTLGVDVGAGPAERRAVRRFLSAELHHHRAGAMIRAFAAGDGGEGVARTYDALQQAAAGASNAATFDALLGEYAAIAAPA